MEIGRIQLETEHVLGRAIGRGHRAPGQQRAHREALALVQFNHRVVGLVFLARATHQPLLDDEEALRFALRGRRDLFALGVVGEFQAVQQPDLVRAFETVERGVCREEGELRCMDCAQN